MDEGMLESERPTEKQRETPEQEERDIRIQG